MATTADIKNGLCIEFNGKPCSIVEFQHVKPGKGPAFVRTKLRNLENGRIIENTFNAGVKIDVIRVERRPYQFLYEDEAGYNFMHNETFEQISLDKNLIENADLMKEGQYVEMMVHADKEEVLTCELPPFVELVVTYTEPGLKGDTASSNALKPATLETGAEVRVPLFINQDEKIKIDTRTRSYVERVRG
ncbi:elongation factor P [Acetobacteroides hydrogenigenes]|uniref:Elongation factor P n=1 Tax=Acetobacteroides hydrogenigenes TaxID=979970 RepID=A0A4R2EJS3_9BACT|nr:elongation factor P [Acetobacteroides hydrogenigenes]TCN68963.1 elongation factor P [Acetobacteroides hydrogenigenes]